MERVYLNNCFNRPRRVYGSSLFGVIAALVVMMVVWGVFSMAFGLIASVVGYSLGRWFEKQWVLGKYQRHIYCKLPLSSAFGGKLLPPSHIKRFF